MNFPAQGLQRTWPQGMLSIALRVFERPFLHAGQTSVDESAEGVASEVVNLIETRDLRDRGCSIDDDEDGHKGESLAALGEGFVVFEEGVREGTQNEGSVGLEDWNQKSVRPLTLGQPGCSPFPHPTPFSPLCARPLHFLTSLLHLAQTSASSLDLFCALLPRL